MFTDHLKVGNFYLEFRASDSGLKSVSLKEELELRKPNSITDNFKIELSEYFSGRQKEFKTPVDIEGTTFQKQVWQSLRDIPYGETKSYKEIALRVGGENYARAVGMANNKNPLPIIIPCHRVVGSNGSLVGYALGLELKRKLIELESSKRIGQ